MHRKPILSTMKVASPDVTYAAYVEVFPRRRLNPIDIARFIWAARGRDAVIVRGSVTLAERYRDLFLALSLMFFAKRFRPRIVITDATWSRTSDSLARGSALRGFGASLGIRIVIRLLARMGAVFCVLSTDEVDSFSTTWRVDASQVVFTPFPASIDPGCPSATAGVGIFAGGNSLRDYTLFEQAWSLLDSPPDVFVAARWTFPTQKLRAVETTHEEFFARMAASRIVVVPLRPDVRSAGQQTYLNAMLMGKLVVVTRAPGVEDYIEDGETGFIAERSAVSLAEVLDNVIHLEEKETRRIATSARTHVLSNHLPIHYRSKLLAIALECDLLT